MTPGLGRLRPPDWKPVPDGHGGMARLLAAFPPPPPNAKAYWPCLALGTKVLTADWRWVPVEALVEGDGLVGFDEDGPAGLAPGVSRGRRYRTSEVTASRISPEPCLEVEFNDGSTVVSTREHPWLARTNRGSAPRARRWVRADHLRPGHSLGVYFETWEDSRSYEAGWLAGMFDGEGSMARNGRGPDGSWCTGNLSVAQQVGPTWDRLVEAVTKFGFKAQPRVGRYDGYAPVGHLSILGGFSEQVRFLGTVRPERLIEKIRYEGRPMLALRERRVVAVRDAGVRPVVILTTSTGTYLAEGMGSHNCPVVYDQGQTEHCTGYSSAGWMTAEAFKTLGASATFDAEAVYAWANAHDDIPGPHDGSTVKAAMLCLHTVGARDLDPAAPAGEDPSRIDRMDQVLWCADWSEVLHYLTQVGPLVFGTAWKSSMFQPTAEGRIAVTGDDAGGHAYLVNGADLQDRYGTIHNSWGLGWAQGGEATIDLDDLRGLYENGGEASCGTWATGSPTTGA